MTTEEIDRIVTDAEVEISDKYRDKRPYFTVYGSMAARLAVKKSLEIEAVKEDERIEKIKDICANQLGNFVAVKDILEALNLKE